MSKPKYRLGEVKGRLNSLLDELAHHAFDARAGEREIHATRVRLKKIKALLRLLDDAAIPGAKGALAQAKRASDQLAPLREHYVLTRLSRQLHIADVAIPPVDARTAISRTRSALPPLVRSLERVRKRVEETKALDQSIDIALKNRKAKCRKAYRRSCAKLKPQRLHFLRKRVKDLLYECQALEGRTAKDDPCLRQLKRIADLTGDAHDLTVLREHMPCVAPNDRRTRKNLKKRAIRLNQRALKLTRSYLNGQKRKIPAAA